MGASELLWFGIGLTAGGTLGICLMCLITLNRSEGRDRQT